MDDSISSNSAARVLLAVPGTAVRNTRNRSGDRISRFVFTVNNYTAEEWLSLEVNLSSMVKWLIIGKETGENGTPHIQGACVIGKQVAFSTIKKWPGLARAHIEIMKGSIASNKTYCSKEGDWILIERP